jgi:hypothetical protein
MRRGLAAGNGFPSRSSGGTIREESSLAFSISSHSASSRAFTMTLELLPGSAAIRLREAMDCPVLSRR